MKPSATLGEEGNNTNVNVMKNAEQEINFFFLCALECSLFLLGCVSSA